MAGVFFHPEELPYVHSKIVTNYDLNQKLAFPVRLTGRIWPGGLPPLRDTKEFTVLDIRGTPWRFVCKFRRTANGGHPQPEVFGHGWRQFIRDREMQVLVGDELVFQLPPPIADAGDAAPVFVMSFRRHVRLFGAIIHTHNF